MIRPPRGIIVHVLISITFVGALSAYVGTRYFSTEARMVRVARQEINERTHTPANSWSLSLCEFDGKARHVTLTAPLGGKVEVVIAPDGSILDFKRQQ